MLSIDIRTIFLSYTTINIVNLFLISLLYLQVRKRFPESLTILISFIMSSFGNLLLFFRDVLTEWVPIVATTLVVSSTVVLLIGFEKFVYKRGIQIQNYILIVVFLLTQYYFTFVKPAISIRSISLSIAYVLLSAQLAWLMLVRVPLKKRLITRGVGLTFCALLVIQIVRVFTINYRQQVGVNYFNLDNFEAIFILSYEIILITLTYNISLMYNKSLIRDVVEQEKEILRLSAEKMQLELDLKNKEISQKELNIASIKESNKNLLNEMENTIDSIPKIRNFSIHKIIRKFKNTTQKSKIWEEFDDRFKEANSEFYEKLVMDYSNLSTNEIRVACLIRQNYTTKEIAEILQRSPKTIENIRGLIRKKVKLQKGTNLTEFLISIK